MICSIGIFRKIHMAIRFLVQGKAAVTLTPPANATVGDAKALLSAQLSLSPDDQVLVHNGRILLDSQRLSSLDLRKRPFILVAQKSTTSLASGDDFPGDLLRQIPASKILRYRRLLDQDASQLNHILQKLAGADSALYERLQSSTEAIVRFFGVDYEEFSIRRFLKSGDDRSDTPAKKPARPAAPPDTSFDRYPVNLLENDFSGHRPAETQPQLEPDAGPGQAGENEIESLMNMGLTRDGAERLLDQVGGSITTAMTLLLMHRLGLARG
jgi:hypothetical protein